MIEQRQGVVERAGAVVPEAERAEMQLVDDEVFDPAGVGQAADLSRAAAIPPRNCPGG